jgi:signal transduction histidine kinase
LLSRIVGEDKPARADLRLMPRKSAPVDVAVHATSDQGRAQDRTIRWSLRDITASREAATARRVAVREQLARRAAQSSIRRLRFLAECARATVQETGVQQLADACVAAAARFFCDTCAVYLFEEQQLKSVSRRSRTPEADERAEALQLLLGLEPAGPGPLRTVLETGELQVFPPLNLSLRNRRELFAAVRKAEARHTIIAPIQGRTGNIGVMCFHCSTQERGFGVQELGTALEVSSRLGLAIDNARLFAAAQAGNNAKTEFLATISHELRTPLTAVIGYAELLMGGLAEPLPPVAHNWLQRIRASAEHQVRLIEDILTYVRAEAEREGVRPRPVRSAEIIDQTIAVLRPSFEQAAVELEVAAPANITLTTDGDRVRQILINLLMNALKFTPKGCVTLGVERSADRVLFNVTDTGVGIAPDHLEKVFEAFWQVDQSDTRRFGGSGLGLAVSRRLARQLGGDLRVESELGSGSRFILDLPIEPVEDGDGTDDADEPGGAGPT